MEKRRKHFFTNYLLVGILITSGLLFFSVQGVKEGTSVNSGYAAVATPSPIPQTPKISDHLSADGSYTLTLENDIEKDGIIQQTFYISNNVKPEKVFLYEQDSNKGNLLFVPENTFSPDHKYLFLTYLEGDQNKYIVMRVDGENMPNNEKYVEVTAAFYNKYPDFKITDVTGWGGLNLLVINTDLPDGNTGPSWWFDATSLSFIRLSTRFN